MFPCKIFNLGSECKIDLLLRGAYISSLHVFSLWHITFHTKCLLVINQDQISRNDKILLSKETENTSCERAFSFRDQQTHTCS